MQRPVTKVLAVAILSVCALAAALALVFICTPKADPSETAYAGETTVNGILSISAESLDGK